MYFCAESVPVGDFRKAFCRRFVRAVFSKRNRVSAHMRKGNWNAVLLYGNFTGKSSEYPERS